MKTKIHKSLEDVHNSIEEIEHFFEGKPKRFADFMQNSLLQSAIYRHLTIIGEAINRIKKEDADFYINQSHGIIALRNHIVHAYDSVRHEEVWNIVINHLPRLKDEVETLLEKFETE